MFFLILVLLFSSSSIFDDVFFLSEYVIVVDRLFLGEKWTELCFNNIRHLCGELVHIILTWYEEHQTFGMEIGWLSSNLLSSRGISFARPPCILGILPEEIRCSYPISS